MARYDKERILETILACAKQYEENLNGKNFLYVIRGNAGKPFCIEIECRAYNFMHLMGIATEMKPTEFYKDCIDGRLKSGSVSVRRDGTTLQKSQVARELMAIHKTARMYGDSAELITDKLVGNVRGCIGFGKELDGKFYWPKTLLKADIRDRATETYPVLAVYQKLIDDSLYSAICYKSKALKDVPPDKLRWPDGIQEKIASPLSVML